jgi:hypothetical protein
MTEEFRKNVDAPTSQVIVEYHNLGAPTLQVKV